jgi:hypothetical protein
VRGLSFLHPNCAYKHDWSVDGAGRDRASAFKKDEVGREDHGKLTAWIPLCPSSFFPFPSIADLRHLKTIRWMSTTLQCHPDQERPLCQHQERTMRWIIPCQRVVPMTTTYPIGQYPHYHHQYRLFLVTISLLLKEFIVPSELSEDSPAINGLNLQPADLDGSWF